MQLKRTEKVKILPTKTSVKLTSKDEDALVFDLLFQNLVVLASGLILALTIEKDRNREYISQRCLNQQFKCK